MTAEQASRILLDFSCLFVEQYPLRSLIEALYCDDKMNHEGIRIFSDLCEKLLQRKDLRDDFRPWLAEQSGGENAMYLIGCVLVCFVDRLEGTEYLIKAMQMGCALAEEYLDTVFYDESMERPEVIRTYALLLVLESREWDGAQQYLQELKLQMTLEDFESADFLSTCYEDNDFCPTWLAYEKAKLESEPCELTSTQLAELMTFGPSPLVF